MKTRDHRALGIVPSHCKPPVNATYYNELYTGCSCAVTLEITKIVNNFSTFQIIIIGIKHLLITQGKINSESVDLY